MENKYLQEAFQALNVLNEEDFDISTEGTDSLKNFLDAEDNTNLITMDIIDTEADTEEEIKDSYVGKIVCDCEVCHSKVYKDKDDIVIDEETGLANIDEECPFCFSTEGYEIIGMVAPYEEVEDEEVVESFKRTRKLNEEFDERIWNKLSSPIKSSLNNAWNLNKSNKWFDAYLTALVDVDIIDEKEKKEILQSNIEDGFNESLNEDYSSLHNTLIDYVYNKLATAIYDNLPVQVIEMEVPEYQVEYCAEEATSNSDRADELLKDAANYIVKDLLLNYKEKNECLEESAASDISEYQKWVDYDMKKYNKISDLTMEKIKSAGFSVVKDQYGDYEVIADRADECLEEDFQKVEIETDTEKMEMSSDENGKTTIVTEPKIEEDSEVEEDIQEDEVEVSANEVDDDSDIEVVAQLDDETESELKSNTTEEEDVIQDDEMVDVDFEEFDEEEFDELGESYLKKVYENVNSFKTSSIKTTSDSLIVEGVITFNSGNKKCTSFIFESKDITKTGKLRFIGENKQLSRGRKAFTLTGKVVGNKLICESLNYNYRGKDSNGSSKRIYGTVKVSK